MKFFKEVWEDIKDVWGMVILAVILGVLIGIGINKVRKNESADREDIKQKVEKLQSTIERLEETINLQKIIDN